MIRSLFLALSNNRVSRKIILGLPFSRKAARRFIAGETLEEAVSAARELNEAKLMASLDYLGENVSTEEEAAHMADVSTGILDAIAQQGADCNISVKLTAFGLDLGPDVCYRNLATVIRRAKEHHNFVRIDMEGSAYTEKTLQTFYRARKEFGDSVGVVIQAYLYRTENDVDRLIAEGANVRLCKGAYKEPPELAFPKKQDADDNYRKLMCKFLTREAVENGAYVGLATHDETIIRDAKTRAREEGIEPREFEFQMLYGIRRDLQEQLVRDGYRMRVYVPFGEQWYPYFMRRLAERPANALFLLKNLFR